MQDDRLEKLPNDPVGELPLEIAATGRIDLEAAVGGLSAGRVQQPRLADARRAVGERDATSSVRCRVEERVQLLELSVSLEQS